MRLSTIVIFIVINIPVLGLVLYAEEASEVLYERQLTEKEQQYSLTVSDIGLKNDRSIKEIRQEMLQTAWGKDWWTVKVELITSQESNLRYLRRTMIGKDEVRLADEIKWTNKAEQMLFLNQEQLVINQKGEERTLAHNEQFAKFLDAPTGFYHINVGSVGLAYENYLDENNGSKIAISIYELPEKKEIDLHEFLRLLIPHQLELHAFSNDGLGVKYEKTIRSEFSNINQFNNGFAWISANKAIYVEGENISLDEVVIMLAEKHPSTLISDIRVERNTWYNREMNNALAKLETSAKITQTTFVDHYAFHLQRLLEITHLPFSIYQESEAKYVSFRNNLSHQIKRWWERNKNTIAWNENLQQFISKKDTPEYKDRIRHNEELAKRKRQLSTPMSEQDIIILKKQLTEQFLIEKRKEVNDLKNAFGANGNKVKWEKKAEDSWTLYYPSPNNGPLTKHSYTGPTIKRVNNINKPLIAIFNESVKFHNEKSQIISSTQYYFQRADNLWIMGAVKN